VVIVQPFFGSVKEYIATVLTQGCPFPLPAHCPHPDCQVAGSLIRWGTYERGALTGEADYRIRVQRVRCKVCGRTHSLLPDFLHPHRHFVIDLLHQAVSLYLLAGLGWRKLRRKLRQEYRQGPARATVREWVASFAYGAGHLLLNALLRHLLALDPGLDLPNSPPKPLSDASNSDRHHRLAIERSPRRLEKGHTFLLLAEQLYALVKQRQPALHFSAAQICPFLLQWLQGQGLPARLFWSPLLPTTPTQPF
jgi:hypothetical protein